MLDDRCYIDKKSLLKNVINFYQQGFLSIKQRIKISNSVTFLLMQN